MMDRARMEQTLLNVSNCMMHLGNQGQKEKFPVSLLEMGAWEWPQGVGLLGLMRYYMTHGNEEILTFIEQWFDKHMPRIDQIERNVNSTCPMLTLTYLVHYRPKDEYFALIRSWAEWVMNHQGLLRTGDGLMQHMITGDPNDDQILIDTLFMTVLFLCRAGKMLGRKDMIAEANYQVLAHIKYLYDPQTGLFFHGWSFKEMNNYGRVYWLRGNGWYTVAIADFMAEQDDLPDELRRMFMTTFTRQVEALIRYWDDDKGLWHTVIRRPDSYIEVSGSSACLCGIMKAVRLGYLKMEDYLPYIRKGLSSALSYVEEDGAVRQVSYGTPIGMDEQFYMDIPCFIMTYGQAMMILLLQEALQPFWQDML